MATNTPPVNVLSNGWKLVIGAPVVESNTFTSGKRPGPGPVTRLRTPPGARAMATLAPPAKPGS